jgi:hypothetical protein
VAIWQEVVEHSRRVKRAILAAGQERLPSEYVRVPQRELTTSVGLRRQILPGVVLQDRVGDQMVMGHYNAELSSMAAPGWVQKKIVERQQNRACEECLPEERPR